MRTATIATPEAAHVPDGPGARRQSHPPGPRLPRPAALPSGRAVVGALLVTVAAVSIFAAYTGASTGPNHNAVASRVSAGPFHRLSADEIQVVKVDLPQDSLQQAFSSVAELEGAVTLAPLEPGEILQRGTVRPADSAGTPGPEFSFAIDRDRAVNGQLQRGETVDLLATYGSGDSAYTTTVVRGAVVADVTASGSSTLGSNGKIALTLTLPSSRSVLETAHATQVAAVTLVRTTGAEDRDGEAPPDAYRPAPPSGQKGTVRPPGPAGGR